MDPMDNTHPFNSPLSGTTRVSRYQKGKTNLEFTEDTEAVEACIRFLDDDDDDDEARDGEWQWHQLDHMQVYISLQTNNHASTNHSVLLQAGCPSCRPTNSIKALKAIIGPMDNSD